MSKPNKICIMCSAAARSNEHVFPAAFGGRRTNRGIYCRKHNNSLGRHVAALLDGLDIFNAMIGVVPDRRVDVRPAPVIDEDGTTYLVTLKEAKIAPPPPLSATPELLGKRVALRFDDELQAKKWIEEQEKAGYKVFSGPAVSSTNIFTKPLRANRTLGEERFRLALLYLALTFLAHYAPARARSAGLGAVRDIVLQNGPVGARVVWEPTASMSQFDANPFRHGHTIAIGLIGPGRVGALICLYGAVQFGIDLGDVPDAQNLQRVVTYIDPLAPSAPKDILVVRDDRPLALSTVAESQSYLRSFSSGTVDIPFSKFMQAAYEDELMAVCKHELSELFALAEEPRNQQMAGIMRLVTRHQQRVYNLMRDTLTGFCEANAHLPEPIHIVFRSFLEEDPLAPKGSTAASEAGLTVACAALADEILKRFDAKALDEGSLAALLGGGDGAAVLLRFFGDIVISSMPNGDQGGVARASSAG